MLLGVTPLRRIAIILSVLLSSITIGVILLSQGVFAATGINQTINFQGRLYNAAGATVPDGYYNIQFKIYQDGAGTTAGNPGGTLEWTEDHLNANTQGVEVRNGFMSVELGSVTAFGNSVDWNQDTLWISMNIGNTNGSCTPFTNCGGDGEMTPMKRLSAVPYAMNAYQLGGKTAGDFIQSGTSPQTADFNITGTGTAATLQAATFDTASAGALTIGGTNATSITLADNTTVNANLTVASGYSLTLAGGNTASRPASPTEGMVYYDTDTKQLLTYANGKWQADRSDAVLVAASDSSAADKAAADYIADGNTGTTADGDQVQINSALTAGSGKKVVLLKGSYTVDAAISIPNNTTLSGVGNGTSITIPNSFNAGINVVTNTDTSTGTGIKIRDIMLDGNKANQTSGTNHGIYLNGMGGGAGGSARSGATLTNVAVVNFRDDGASLTGSSNNTISGSVFRNNGDDGIGVVSSSSNNTITSNLMQGNVAGVTVNSSNNNTVASNTIETNTSLGLTIGGTSQYNTFSSNTITGSSTGINVNSSNNTYASNTLSSNNTGVTVTSSGNNSTFTGNTVTASSTNGFDISGVKNTFSSNTVYGSGANGINVNSTATDNSFAGNAIENSGDDGFDNSGDNNTVTGNTISNNTGAGIYSKAAATDNTYTGNTITTNNAQGIAIFGATNKISNNRIKNAGASSNNNAIYLSAADNNTVTYNTITDSSATTTNYPINIFDSTSDNNYLAGNTFDVGTINDSGTGTRYANQSKTAGGLDVLYKQASSATAFQIQNASGSALLTADSNSTNNRIQIGSSTTDATAIFFMLDSYNNGTDPTGADGAMYYNTNLGKFRCYQGGWVDCVNTAGTGANTALSNLASTNINAALNTTAGNLTLQTTTSGNIILNPVGTIELQKATNVTGSLTASTSVLTPSIDRASAGALSIGGTTATSVVIGNSSGTAGVTLSASTIQVGIATSPTTLQATAQTTSNTQGSTFTIQGANGNGTGNGGTLALQGGNGGGSAVYGGNVTITGGTGTTSNGLVLLGTPTFSTTTNDSACYTGGSEVASSCTIAQTSVNNSAAILVGFSTDGQTATLPDPSITTAGRVVYVTASNLSKDFTLSVNGGGQGNQIAMRKNTTATMIWNGADWTAAGASSSTTMQAAYDNTLQSAGGAELVVSKTSATNGLTIRDSTVNSVDGTLLSVQTKSAAGLFQVNSNVTEYVSNAGAETAGASAATFPASTWSAVGSSTISRNTTTNNNSIATGQASVSVATTSAAQDGVKNTLVTSLGTKQNYNVSFTARLSSGTFTDLNVYYSVDGTAASVPCTSSQAIATSIWTKINCTFTAPTSGITSSNAILIRQTGSGTARTLYIDNLSVTIAADYNYATDGSVSDGTNFATNWSAVSGTTVTRNTTVGNDASDSAQVVTGATAGQGVRNLLSINPLPSTLYRITAYAASSNSFNDFTIRYSRDGGTNYVGCADYNTQNVSTSTTSFTKITCYITTDSTAATNPYVYFTQNSGTARTFYVDTFSMNLSSNTTPNVQIGGGSNGGPTTLFTLDRGASAPIASNNDALLGSMYYDTTLGKLQCYEADGWGACGSSPDNIITISPEYTNAVLHGTGVGTMTSDLCSDPLNINDGSSGQATVCGTNETYNFYKWTSPQNSAQTYSIYVTYQLPGTFRGFNSGQTSIMGRTDSSNATVNYQIYRNSGSGLTACGSTVAVSTGSQSAWQIGTASGAADPSTCGFTAGNSIVFKINMTTSSNANAYVGNLNFAFNNK